MRNRHPIICASYLILLKDDKVLLLRRFNTGYKDGFYSLPAGHVEDNESVSDAIVREATEEIGISIEKKNIKLSCVLHRKAIKDENDERLDFFFSCSVWTGEVKNVEPNKCDDLSWYDINSLPDNVIPYVSQAIKQSIKGETYAEIGW